MTMILNALFNLELQRFVSWLVRVIVQYLYYDYLCSSSFLIFYDVDPCFISVKLMRVYLSFLIFFKFYH